MPERENHTERRLRVDGNPDERRFARTPAIGLTLRNPVRAEVHDLSPGGIGIQCTTSLNVHSRHLFTLGIGERIERVRGEVRWCRMMGNKVLPNGEVEPVYLAGIVFLSQAGSQRTHSLLALLSLLLA
jgi:hypothetical protein